MVAANEIDQALMDLLTQNIEAARAAGQVGAGLPACQGCACTCRYDCSLRSWSSLLFVLRQAPPARLPCCIQLLVYFFHAHRRTQQSLWRR